MLHNVAEITSIIALYIYDPRYHAHPLLSTTVDLPSQESPFALRVNPDTQEQVNEPGVFVQV